MSGHNKTLPNHLSYLSAFDPRAPSFKRPTTQIGPYPGGVPYLTDQYINNDNLVNKTPAQRTNGVIRTSVITRTRDQNRINVNQLAFMDTQLVDKPIFWNIQRLNYFFCDTSVHGGYTLLNKNDTLKQYLKKDAFNLPSNRIEAERKYIMNRFKLYGAVANRDADNLEDMPRERVARCFTISVKGVTWILDYWSTATKIIRPYDQCYFVLKKVKVENLEDFRFQDNITINNARALMPIDEKLRGKWVWQILPYHTSDNSISPEAYTWTESETKNVNGIEIAEEVRHIGSFWKCGNAHEYVDTGYRGVYNTRDTPEKVARDITHLHLAGNVAPIHFYLRLGMGV